MTARSAHASAPGLPPTDTFPGLTTRWLWVLTFAAALIAYLPTWEAGYIWDDPGHVTRADLRGVDGLGRIWFEPGATQQYYPLLHSAFWLEHRLWGDAPLGYHLVNVLWHALAACLFGTLLRRLAVPGAWFAALLFALHPVAVESVAWVSEQKNTLSLVLYLGAALAYLRFADARTPARYGLATLLFAGALATKTVTATLPAALLVVLAWRRGAMPDRRDLLALLPWLTLGVAAGLHTAWFERDLIGARGEDFDLSLLERGLLAGRILWFYLGKLAWPAELIFIYPRWEVSASDPWQYLPAAGILVLVGALVVVRRRAGGALAAFLLFAGTLVPVLGFLNVYPFRFSYVADHFQYHASLAMYALAGAAAMKLAPKMPPPAFRTGTAALLLLLGVLTTLQSRTYRDAETLYRTTIAKNPDCWMAYNNLAIELADQGRLEEAVSLLGKALALRPDYAQAHNNIGDDLTRLGRAREAVGHLRRALELQPDYPEAHYNLGAALMELGRPGEGIASFEAALRLRPAYSAAARALGRALATEGPAERRQEALPLFERAVELAPQDAEARIDLGFYLLTQGRTAEALPHLRSAAELRPDMADAHVVLGRALVQAGRFPEAISAFERALAIEPSHAGARHELRALRRGP